MLPCHSNDTIFFLFISLLTVTLFLYILSYSSFLSWRYQMEKYTTSKHLPWNMVHITSAAKKTYFNYMIFENFSHRHSMWKYKNIKQGTTLLTNNRHPRSLLQMDFGWQGKLLIAQKLMIGIIQYFCNFFTFCH